MNGFCYLALVTDVFSRKIVGYDISASLELLGALRALKKALYKTDVSELIHHSDRGLQYCSDKYQEILQNNHIKCSMTEKYDPYQNAIAERINGILKQEFIRDLDINDIEIMGSLKKSWEENGFVKLKSILISSSFMSSFLIIISNFLF